jgi:hypothetical protein
MLSVVMLVVVVPKVTEPKKVIGHFIGLSGLFKNLFLFPAKPIKLFAKAVVS